MRVVTFGDRVYKNATGLDARTLRHTFQRVAAYQKAGILIDRSMLTRDPSLVQLVRGVAEIARGKAYFTSTLTPRQYIMMDFLKRKRRRTA